ncbi:MAG TPA: class II fructose-bisphosphate aldolase [Candidatus Choladousia intestinipullorum]|nr:class II fructose-bisphosphate aldolase [Candidatus Choladousia intestinipullorum]
MLVNMKDMLQDAEKHNYAIGSLNTPNLETLRAIISAAEELGCPVIINHAQGHEPVVALETIAPLMKMYAENAKVPVAMHIDHGLDIDFCMRAVRAGFTSIMCDRSAYPLEQNIALTKSFVDLVRPLGITVEAELGAMPNNMPTEVPGQEASDLSDLTKYFTKVDEAKRFAEETGVDVLAISIGTVHGMYKEKSNLDIERIKAIRAAITDENVHLGMHGCSGTEPDQVVAAVDAGIKKINYFTAMDTAVAPVLEQMIKDYEGRPLNYSVMVNVAMEELKKGAKKAMEMFMTCKK